MVVSVERDLSGALVAARASGDAEFARSCELSGVRDTLPSPAYAPDVDLEYGTYGDLLDKLAQMVGSKGVTAGQCRMLRLYAAWKGHLESQFVLGYDFGTGRNVKLDFVLARYWYGKAAEAGHPWAQNNLGVLYDNGLGGEADNEKAVYWYMKSAENGNDMAKVNLGENLVTNTSDPRDYHKAARLLKDFLSRHPYNARAHLMLARCHENIGGKRRQKLAIHHYQEALDFGLTEAREALRRLTRGGRTAIFLKLPTESGS